MTIPLTPSLQVNITISDILRLLLTQEVSGTDRLLLISELEQVLQSLVTDHTINVEFDTQDNGNEKVLTIITTSTLTGLVEEQLGEEEEEDSSNNNGDDNEDPSPKPPEDPEPPPEEPSPEPDPPIEEIPEPPFG